MSQTNDTPRGAGAEVIATTLLSELRARLTAGEDRSSAELLVPALARLADGLIVVACDRLARGDMAAFYETALEGMTDEERAAWRRQVTAGWLAAAERRWQEREDLRRALLEAILFARALAVG